ncbi:MAG: hypothetical protein ACFE8G_13850 [Candidatus Hermodarchaeota archaeon]
MTKVFNNTKLIKDKNKEDNSIELNESSISKSTDKLDWDFILDREWSKTKK